MMLGMMENYYMNKNDIKSSADMFLYKATVDFNSAKYLLEAFNEDKIEIDIEKIYFDLQQCSEKCLKSILSSHNIKFPKIHDIEELIELCNKNNIILIDNVEYLIRLTDYAVDGRYSIIHDDLDNPDKYLNILDKLLKFVKKALK